MDTPTPEIGVGLLASASNPEERPGEERYRQTMVRLREEKGLIKVTQRKLAHQVLTELKSYRFTTVELGEINNTYLLMVMSKT